MRGARRGHGEALARAWRPHAWRYSLRHWFSPPANHPLPQLALGPEGASEGSFSPKESACSVSNSISWRCSQRESDRAANPTTDCPLLAAPSVQSDGVFVEAESRSTNSVSPEMPKQDSRVHVSSSTPSLRSDALNSRELVSSLLSSSSPSLHCKKLSQVPFAHTLPRESFRLGNFQESQGSLISSGHGFNPQLWHQQRCFAGHASSSLAAPAPVLAQEAASDILDNAQGSQTEDIAENEASASSSHGILVRLGLIPPHDPKAEEEAQKKEVIVAYRRYSTGKTTAGKERRAGRVPGVLFEQANGHLGGNKKLISVEEKQLEKLIRKYGRSFFLSRVFEMRVFEVENAADAGPPGPGGKPEASLALAQIEHVLPKAVHEHWSKDKVLNATFLKKPDAKGALVKLEVPLQFINEDACPGIRKGGWLFCMRRVVPVECPWENVPPFIEVDLGSMTVGQVLRFQDLKLRPNTRFLVRDLTLPVCKIAGSKSLEGAAD